MPGAGRLQASGFISHPPLAPRPAANQVAHEASGQSRLAAQNTAPLFHGMSAFTHRVRGLTALAFRIRESSASDRENP